MKKIFVLTVFAVCLLPFLPAQEIDSTMLSVEAIEASLDYQTGTVELDAGNAILNVPEGFRYLGPEQGNFVLSDLWGNPEDPELLGLLVPADKGVLDDDGWVFTINYDEMGYVEDEDAEDIDYDELLEEQQSDTRAANVERKKLGYPTAELIGWAAKPHYDKTHKVLHWAKELNFDSDSINTLNYNLRVLGRKGIFLLNAVANMSELPVVEQNIDKVITSVEFQEGSRYVDFDPDVDEVAAWTVGGLVAGKVLAKTGFFALLAKFGKFILIGLAALGGSIWRFFKGEKKEDAPSAE
ncbi:MAG: DUF2167 domain-containing protein [Bacteroidota bacterium]